MSRKVGITLLLLTLLVGCSEAPAPPEVDVNNGPDNLLLSPRVRSITTDGLALYGAALNDAGAVSFVAHDIAAPVFYSYNAYLVRRSGERIVTPDLKEACGVVEYMTMQAVGDFGRMLIRSDRAVPGPLCQLSFFWSQGEGFQALAPLPGGVVPRGVSMNRFGWVSGTSSPKAHGSEGMVAVVWSPDGQPIDIGSPAGFPQCADLDHCDVFSWAGPINDLGVVLAYGIRVMTDGTSEEKAYLWSARGGVEPINAAPVSKLSQMVAMNGLGTAVGGKLMWHPRRGFVDLTFEAVDINALGQVVGYDEGGPVLRRLTGEIVRLGTGGRALAINNVGEVLVQREFNGPLEVWSGF